MSKELATRESVGEAVERVMIAGDLAKLSAEERVGYYKSVCESVGLNPLTRPLEYITLNGKLTLYARKDATDQLRAINQVSINIVSREVVEGCYVVTARATMPSGRCDESIGACPIEGLKGEARSNQMMKVETKAKRRVTLSICGMGMLDESEVDSIPGARLGENVPAVTTAPKTFGKPKTDAQEFQNLPALEELVEKAKAAAAPLPESKDSQFVQPLGVFASGTLAKAAVPDADEPSTVPQQNKFAAEYRLALPEKFRPHSDQLRRAALAEEGYIVDGVGSSKAILRKDFQRVANKLIRAAKEMTDPFLGDDSDIPDNLR